MQISARSALMAGVTTLTASAVVIAPSVQPAPPPRPEPTIQLAASSQVLQQQQAVLQQFGSIGEATQFLVGIIIPPGLGTPPPAPPPIPPAPVPTSVASFVESAYLAIEPWVDYGFEVGAWAFSWVPWIGWLAPQIWPIGYNFGERLVHAIVFNITDWLQGQGSFIQNLGDWAAESIDALIDFGIDQWNFWIGFPLPPLPFSSSTTQTTTLIGSTEAPVQVANAASDLVNAVYIPVRNTIDYGVNVLQGALAPIPLVSIAGDQVNLVWDTLVRPIADSVVDDLINPVLNAPLNINSYINGAIGVGSTTVNSLINTGIAEVNYVLGFPLLPPVSVQAGELDRTAEVSAIPSIVKNSLNGIQSGGDPVNSGAGVDETAKGPLAEVADTVRSVRKEIRANVNAAVERRTNKTVEAGEAVEAAGNGVVRAQGQVRGAIAKAADDVVNAVRAGRPGNAADDVANSPTTVVRSLRDTAKKVVNEVRETAKDVRQAVKDGPAANNDEDDDE